MAEQEAKASEFVEALRDSGFEFDTVAEIQHRRFRLAGKLAVGWAALSLGFMGGISYTITKESQLKYYPEVIAMEAFLVTGGLLNARDEVRRAHLAQQERDNSLELAAMVKSSN